MPLTSAGRDIAPARNPRTGKFDLQWDDTNNPYFDDSDSHTVLSLLCEHEGGYWADPTGTRGSRLHKIRQDQTGTAEELAAAAEKALTPPLQEGRLREAMASAKRVRPGRYDLGVKYKNREGKSQNTRLPIGG